MTTTKTEALLRDAAQTALLTLDGIADASPRDKDSFETPADWIAWAKSRARFAADALRGPLARELHAERVLRQMLEEDRFTHPSPTQPTQPAKCDGNHGGPRCADPECWNDLPDAQGLPEPMTVLSDPDILRAAEGWREFDAPEGADQVVRMIYGACRSVLNAYLLRARQSIAQATQQAADGFHVISHQTNDIAYSLEASAAQHKEYLAAKQAAGQAGEVVAWVPTKQLEKRETTTRGYLWFSNPMNASWTALYTRPAAVPEWQPIETAPTLRRGQRASPQHRDGRRA